MERLAGIEHAIEVGREEGPRFIAERSREAREALEAGMAAVGVGVAAAGSEVLERLRSAPRGRPGAIRLIVLSVALSLLATAAAIAVSRLWERARRQREERIAEGEAGSAPVGVRAVVPVPVSAGDESSEDATEAEADEAEGRIAASLAS